MAGKEDAANLNEDQTIKKDQNFIAPLDNSGTVTNSNQPLTESGQTPQLEISGSRQLTSWIAEQRASLAFTTYQSGKIFLVGLKPNGNLSIFERTFNRAMGLWASSETLYLSSLYQIWRFDNALQMGQLHQGYDRLYVPQLAYTTGDIDAHDITVDPTGKVYFVNTLFSCLCTLSESYSFVPFWKPNFISKLAAEDRCHLNGVALEKGKPKYVTAASQSDVMDGWRDHRGDGGIVIDIESNEIIASGLSMPHSPRIYEEKLWLLNSGTGEFGFVDLKTGKFEAVVFCPGYLRGLDFFGDFAVVGLSKPRENKTFQGLLLDKRLAEKNVEARCALQIVDLRSGDVVHQLTIDGIVEELYDVAILPGVIRPMALGLKTEEIRRIVTVGEPDEDFSQNVLI